MNYKERAVQLLALADITIDGENPWDIQVHNENFYKRIFSGGSLALGESYMDGWWDVDDLSEFINKILQVDIREKIGQNFETWFFIFKAKLTNRQNRKRSREVVDGHYDISNDLYMSFLDFYNQYTCGYWSGSTQVQNLDEAQEAKLDLVCKKLNLKKGERVLDIGCGWGGFAKYAAEKYGVEVVGITISKEQVKLARENTKGLPVEIRLQDYRDINEKFNHIVSLGMFEHVGHKNYKEYMEVVNRSLEEDGLFLLHTIGGKKTVYATEPWFHKYIFPNGMIPSIKQIGESIEELFVMEDWHNFGADYDKTLMEWFKNFDKNWGNINDSYNERFYRMWKYYLLVSAGSFRARKNHLWQIVLSKNGVRGGYKSVR